MTEHNTHNEAQQPRPQGRLYDLGLGIGRVEGMVGQALSYLSDHKKRLDDHEKRIHGLETRFAVLDAKVVVITALAASIVSAAGWFLQNYFG